jgi:hypothetical protein
MNVELKGYYPIPPKKNSGYIATCHVRIVDAGLDIRGILVRKNKLGYFIVMPHKQTYDPIAKKKVTYPCLHFHDPELHKEFLKAVQNLLKGKKHD